MGYDRSSEPRRSRSGGRINYGRRRGGRADPRSPDFRRQRRGGYRGFYHASSPEYGGRYRRRSPSGTRYGRETRTYQSGRSAPYRRSRSPSPDHRRSRSADSNSRNRRYLHRDVPSARFGSKASYLRSRGANRGVSRSRSRVCRRNSPSQRSRVERRDESVRSQSRSRCPGKHGEPKEGSRKHYTGRQLWDDRAPDRYEAASGRERKLRQPCSPGKPFAKEHSACQSRSQHSEGRWHSPGEPRARRVASPTRHSSPYDRASKWSRSRTRSASASGKRTAAMARRGSLNAVRRSRRTSRSVDRDRKAAAVADEHLSRRSRSLHRRSSTLSRREGERISNRRSLNYDRASFRRSRDAPRRIAGETANRNSRDRGQSPRKPHSTSRGRIAVELSGGSQQPEHHSRRESSRSADCPTPDLVSSRPWKGDDGEEPDMSKRISCQDRDAAAPSSQNDAAEPRESHTSGGSDTSWNMRERRPKQRQSASLSRSPCAHPMVSDVGEPDAAKESQRGRSRSPRTKEHAATENDLKSRTETSALTMPCRVPDQEESSCYGNTFTQENDEACSKKNELTAPGDVKKDQAVLLLRRDSRSTLEERVQADERRLGDPAPPETPLESAAPRPVGGTLNSSGSSISCTDIRSKREVRRMVVKRRIVATEPGPSGPLSASIRGMYHASRPSPPKRYFRVQRLFPDRSGRVIPNVDRFRPVNVIANRWGRFEDERFHLACPPFPGNTRRSVRLVGGYNDRSSFFQAQHLGRNITSNEYHRGQLYDDTFDHGGQPCLGALQMGSGAFMRPSRGRGRRQAGAGGRGVQVRRQASAASNADGKWSHDLFEQLSNEPERKRRRFNLYGEKLERVED